MGWDLRLKSARLATGFKHGDLEGAVQNIRVSGGAADCGLAAVSLSLYVERDQRHQPSLWIRPADSLLLVCIFALPDEAVTSEHVTTSTVFLRPSFGVADLFFGLPVKIKDSWLALTLSLGLLAGCEQPIPVGVSDKRTVSVVVYQLKQPSLIPPLTLTGEASNPSMAIRARATAIVKQVLFTTGQTVKKGDVLYELDEVPLRAALAISDAQVKLTRAAYKDALHAAAKTHTLLVKGSLTSVENDQALALVSAAKDQYQAALASRRGDAFSLRQSKVVAPMNGTLDTSTVSVGDLVTADAESLVTITQRDQQWVEFTLSRDQFDALELSKKPAGELVVTLTDGTVAGVSHLEPIHAFDRLHPAATMRARLLAPSESFIPGDEVQIDIKASAAQLISIPKVSLREDMDGHYVFVVVDGKVDVRRVIALHWSGPLWLVSEGLSPDDQVITSNFTKIRVGARVDVAPGEESAVRTGGEADVAPKS